MRILTVTNLYPPDVIGGYELGCGQMMQALRARGHEVTVLTARPRRPVSDEPGVLRRLRLDFSGGSIDSANVGVLVDAIRAIQPDVVYLWNITLVGPLGVAGALAHLQVPVLWHIMDDVPRHAASVGGAPVAAIARALSRRMRAAFICCSDRLVKENADAGFEFGDRVTLMPNWAQDCDTRRSRGHFPASGHELRLVTAGQLAPHKGMDIAIEAAAILHDHGRHAFSLDIYGTGLDDHYELLLLRRGLRGTVRMRGFLPQAELGERFWDYDLFLFPTWAREPMGFAPIEAAARGCLPLVNGDCGFAEWFADGVDCLKAARTPDAFAAVIAAVLDRRIDIAPIAQRARRRIAESFTLERMVGPVEEALEHVTTLPAARGADPDETYHLVRFAEALVRDALV